MPVSPQTPIHRLNTVLGARGAPSNRQRGVVLIVALIMLVVISLITTFSVRSATSTEALSGNVRTTQLATQVAEIALRYCEEAVVQINSGTVTLLTVPVIQDYAAPPAWQNMANWDATPTPAFVLPASSVNQSGIGSTFSRPPECMVERMRMVDAGGAISTTSTYVVTARGFGPEVAAADAARSRPAGTEIWLQSTIELGAAP